MGYRLLVCQEVRVHQIFHAGRQPFSGDLVWRLSEHSRDERVYAGLVYGFDLRSRYINIIAQSVLQFR
jgi:hypothetical protein